MINYEEHGYTLVAEQGEDPRIIVLGWGENTEGLAAILNESVREGDHVLFQGEASFESCDPMDFGHKPVEGALYIGGDDLLAMARDREYDEIIAGHRATIEEAQATLGNPKSSAGQFHAATFRKDIAQGILDELVKHVDMLTEFRLRSMHDTMLQCGEGRIYIVMDQYYVSEGSMFLGLLDDETPYLAIVPAEDLAGVENAIPADSVETLQPIDSQ